MDAYDGTPLGYVVKWDVIQVGASLAKAEGQAIVPDAVALSEVRSETSDLKHGRGTIPPVLDPSDSHNGQFSLFSGLKGLQG